MSFILNIGLARDGNSNIGVGTALREIANDFALLTHSVRHTDTEFTVVAEVIHLRGELHRSVTHLCELLGQGCIAIYSTHLQEGQLIGPKAAEWGSFDPAFFLLLDGTRLSEATLPIPATETTP